MVVAIILSTLIAYFLGGIPFALVLGKKLSGGIDVRQYGSKNTGATNVVRVLGLKIGIPVFVCDVLKATIAVLLAYFLVNLCWTYLGNSDFSASSYMFWKSLAMTLAMIAAPLGHCYSPYLHFKGGKAVATSLGGAIVVVPLATLAALIVFILVVVITRYISAGSLSAAVTIFIAATLFYWGNIFYILGALFLALLVIIRHKDNIKRLLSGAESKFSVAARESGADKPQ